SSFLKIGPLRAGKPFCAWLRYSSFTDKNPLTHHA
ncbi:MAG: hypothetical protein ACI9FG_000512, partial [Crocinitomicaceae bacterium]